MSVIELKVETRLDRFPLRVDVALPGVTALLGPSGAGKTTLVECIAGLRRSRGRITVAGRLLQDSSAGIDLVPERRRIGLLPQDALLFPHRDVQANLRFSRAGRSATEVEVEEVLARLELTPLRARYPRHLSGGERRRVALGRALLSAPELLVLDEPTQGLDPERARRALGFVRELVRERGLRLLLVTHRRDEALALADHALVLEAGAVRAQGPARQVLAEVALGEDQGRLENVVEATVDGHAAQRGVTRVHLEDGLAFSIPWSPGLEPGSVVELAIDAEALLIATRPVAGLSARNAFEGAVEELRENAGSVFVRIGSWWAHLTAEAAEELELAPGRQVWLVAKTHSWRVIAAGVAARRSPSLP